MNVHRLANLYALGRISTNKLNKIAQQLKKDGKASPSLEEMLESGNAYSDRQKTLFEKALNEIGQSIPSQVEAANAITVDIANSIIIGEIDEYEGSRKIWKDVLEHLDNETPLSEQFSVFKNYASAIESYRSDSEQNGGDHDAKILECERAIKEAARKLVNEAGRAA